MPNSPNQLITASPNNFCSISKRNKRIHKENVTGNEVLVRDCSKRIPLFNNTLPVVIAPFALISKLK